MDDSYCECGYTGPLCSECAASYFFVGSEGCSKCSNANRHAPNIALVSVFAACLLVASAVAISNKKKILASSFYQEWLMFRRVAIVKFRILFFAAQVR